MMSGPRNQSNTVGNRRVDRLLVHKFERKIEPLWVGLLRSHPPPICAPAWRLVKSSGTPSTRIELQKQSKGRARIHYVPLEYKICVRRMFISKLRAMKNVGVREKTTHQIHAHSRRLKIGHAVKKSIKTRIFANCQTKLRAKHTPDIYLPYLTILMANLTFCLD